MTFRDESNSLFQFHDRSIISINRLQLIFKNFKNELLIKSLLDSFTILMNEWITFIYWSNLHLQLVSKLAVSKIDAVKK